MKRKTVLFGLAGIFMGLFLAACAGSVASQGGAQEMSWGELTWRAASQDNFLGYFIPLVLATVAVFLRWQKLRFVILGFSMVYLGFFLGLRISGLGAPTTFMIFLNNFGNTIGLRNNWSFYLTWAVLIIGALFTGRLFCGWVCPMGAVQQFLYRREQGVLVRPRLHKWLSYVRYAVLVAMVPTVFAFGARYWGAWDPFRTLFRIEAGNAIGPYVLMGVVLLASVFVFAPWCRYACPLGAALSLFSKVSLFKVRLDESKCTDCKRCARLDCGYGAIVAGGKGVKPKVSYLDCTGCGECITKCPEKAFSFSMKKAAGQKKPE